MLVILSVSLAAAVILAVVAPGLMSRNSRETNAKADRILSALNRYATDNSGTYPPDLLSLVDGDPGTCNLVNDPGDPNYSTLQGWCGPYLFRDFLEFPDGFQTDAWGTLFGYSGGVSLQSAGPDREWGTGDDLSF
jgi:hypothetical protein